MAKLETIIRNEDFNELLSRIQNGIMGGSISASLEDYSDFSDGHSRVSVRVFERYSWLGGNRVSLSVTLYQPAPGEIRVSAIASGGSQALFYKINTFGEEAFLDKLREIL